MNHSEASQYQQCAKLDKQFCKESKFKVASQFFDYEHSIQQSGVMLMQEHFPNDKLVLHEIRHTSCALCFGNLC